MSSRQFGRARMGAGRWERSLPWAARLVSLSTVRLTTADGSAATVPNDGANASADAGSSPRFRRVAALTVTRGQHANRRDEPASELPSESFWEPPLCEVAKYGAEASV